MMLNYQINEDNLWRGYGTLIEGQYRMGDGSMIASTGRMREFTMDNGCIRSWRDGAANKFVLSLESWSLSRPLSYTLV